MKAAFLLNFAKFVEWPPGSYENPADPIVICVFGKNPFGRSLEETAAGKTIEGRPLVVQYLSAVKQSSACHILFIAASETRHEASIVAELKAPGLLTIADSDPSGRSGGGAVICFRLEGEKVRFDIDTGSADREKLKISSRLLTLAHAVTRGGS